MGCPLLNVWRGGIASCRFHQSQADSAEPIKSEGVAPLLREDDESRRYVHRRPPTTVDIHELLRISTLHM
jgi:hypothetical protein